MTDIPFAIPVSGGRFLVYDTNRAVLDWASDRIGLGREWPDDATCITLQDEGGTICAVWVFCRFEASDCEIHIATNGRRNWASRDVLAAVSAFPFWQLKLHRVTAPVACRNIASQIMCIKLGFVPECLKRNALPNDDVVQLVMFKDRCPWLGQEV